MKKSRFTDSQIKDALKRVESGISVPDIRTELGISTATFYRIACGSKPNSSVMFSTNR